MPNNIPIFMKKDCRHTIWPRRFGWVKLLKCCSDFISCKDLSKLSIHVLSDTSRQCINNLTNSTWRGSGINLFKIRYCCSNNTFLTLTPKAIIIPNPQDGVLFPSFKSTGMKKPLCFSPLPCTNEPCCVVSKWSLRCLRDH